MLTGYMDPDSYLKFLEAQKAIRKVYEDYSCSAINAVFARNGSRATLQLRCKEKLFKTLEIRPKSIVLDEPSRFISFSRATVEKACFISSIKDFPVKKITLELDVHTGHAVLSAD